ncbi:MAG: hypothetical protein Fur0025_46360 [Oscillatoriaceae cyanobacterium]
MNEQENPNKNQVIDVAIVGGGVSGAYTGWRLMKSKKFAKVHLYELSDRIGGRLLSVPVPGMPHIQAELGGMFFSEAQAIVWELVKLMQLNVVEGTVEDENNLLYLRGKHLRFKDIPNPQQVPYNLQYQEMGMSSDDLYAYAVQSVIPTGKELTPDYFKSPQWQQIREHWQVQGEHLYNISIWDLLLKVLSSEAYNLCLDTGFFYSDLGTWNAAQAIESSMSVPYDQKWFMLEKGYEQLPKTLAAEFEREGGWVHCHHRLTKFQYNQSTQLIELQFVDQMGQPQPPVQAKHLVLAMPKRALELLAEQNPDNFLFQNPQFVTNMQTVTGAPAYKLFLGYDYPWWRNVGVKAGHSSTDLPMRQCYYFGTESEQPGGDPNNSRSLLLANYPDDRAASFWRSMAYDPQVPEKHPAFEGESARTTLKTSFLNIDYTPYVEPLVASRNMVQTAQQQLKALHGISYIPQPYTAMYLDWTKDPYGGGWHSWNPHCKPWEIMQQMRHPITGINLYICGEAYSNVQSWVQGALNSAELMLEENFKLDRPEWLPPDYDLGP